jgi:transposase InsO family protein
MTDRRSYGLDQEYITPYAPEQNGMIERFFRTQRNASGITASPAATRHSW